MLVNLFVRFDNPDLKQHRCYRTVYRSIRFIMYHYDFCFFFCVAFILKHLASRSSVITLRIAFILQMYYKPDIY